jgi:hypothetical protein
MPVRWRDLGRRAGISGSERRHSWVMLIADRGIDEADAEDGSLAAIVAGHGGELQRLVDGCGLVTFPSGAHETWRAARTALAWRARHPASRIALAAGPGVHAIGDGSAPQIGEVIDRAARELERTAPGVIRLEPAARRLLERESRGGTAILHPGADPLIELHRVPLYWLVEA